MDREMLRVEDLPVLQNKVYPDAEAARNAPRGRIVLAQGRSDGLIFNSAFDPALLSYDADYQNEQAYSSVFREHLDQVLGIVRRHFRTPSLIEVGCGKGYFLEHLRAAGYEAAGIDPAYEGDSPHVVKAAFTQELGMTADAIVLRHVLEHIQDPMSFLRAVAGANGGQGRIYIEVPCFDWICERRAWFDIFYEHVNYFRAADFQRMFGRIHEMGHLFGGQYQYVVADLSSLQPLTPEAREFALPEGFLNGIERSKAIARAATGPKAVWGASSKGVIFAHHLECAGIALDLAIDINPVKQQRHMAGTGLPIFSPAHALQALPENSLVFVMNSNYFDEIAQQSRHRFHLVKVDQHDF